MNTQQSLALFLMLLATFCWVAQADTQLTPSSDVKTGVEGSIILHNISGGPVKMGVPDEKPLANITFVVKKGDAAVASFTTDEQGRFQISLPPGHYRVVRKDWNSRVGFYGPFEVEIAAGEMKKIQWDCDTGMQ